MLTIILQFYPPAVIRFFKKLVATKDDDLCELIMKEDLFSPIIQVLKLNNSRYNLVDSAILELFEFIQTEEMMGLMNHIMTNFGNFLDTIDYVNTFKVMRQKNDALQQAIKDNALKPDRSSLDK